MSSLMCGGLSTIRATDFHVRLSAVEKEKVAIAATITGKPMAVYVREVALAAAEATIKRWEDDQNATSDEVGNVPDLPAA